MGGGSFGLRLRPMGAGVLVGRAVVLVVVVRSCSSVVRGAAVRGAAVRGRAVLWCGAAVVLCRALRGRARSCGALRCGARRRRRARRAVLCAAAVLRCSARLRCGALRCGAAAGPWRGRSGRCGAAVGCGRAVLCRALRCSDRPGRGRAPYPRGPGLVPMGERCQYPSMTPCLSVMRPRRARSAFRCASARIAVRRRLRVTSRSRWASVRWSPSCIGRSKVSVVLVMLYLSARLAKP